MRINKRFAPALVVGVMLCVIVTNGALNSNIAASKILRTQEPAPEVPDDLSLIYIAGTNNAPVPLPFESLSTSVPVSVIAQTGSVGYAELKGGQSTLVANPDPRFYLFVNESLQPPPHFLVRLTSRKNRRRLTVFAEKKRIGFSPLSDAVIKLQYRVVSRVPVRTRKGLIFYVLYVEARPLAPLATGEYAFIGNNFTGLSTFRVAGKG